MGQALHNLNMREERWAEVISKLSSYPTWIAKVNEVALKCGSIALPTCLASFLHAGGPTLLGLSEAGCCCLSLGRRGQIGESQEGSRATRCRQPRRQTDSQIEAPPVCC